VEREIDADARKRAKRFAAGKTLPQGEFSSPEEVETGSPRGCAAWGRK